MDIKTFAESASTHLEAILNPTGQALAAEHWVSRSKKKPDGSPESGFSPMCKNKFDRNTGCQLGKGGRCKQCDLKEYVPVTAAIIREHMLGTKPKHRRGIYPMLPGNLTAWVAVDLDNHDGQKDPSRDLRALIQVCRALEVPFVVFSSNSGKGYHGYIFFESPVPAFKARALMLGLLDRAGVDISHRRDEDGSFDCLFPKQDAL